MSQFKAKMVNVLDLTKAGKLGDAVSVIQSLLKGGEVPVTSPSLDADVIDMNPPKHAGEPWRAPLREGDAVDQARVKQPSSEPVPGMPQECGFTTHTFANAYGSRTYKLYIPASYHGQATALVVMMHGCTQSADDFAAGTQMNALAEEFGILVAYPEQTRNANPSKCWNWFNASDQKRDMGEPSIIAGLTREIMATYAIDPAKVFVAGLSAGGAAAAVLGQTYPDLYSAVGIHSGLASGSARDMMSAFGVMKTGATSTPDKQPEASKVRAIVFHGDKDDTVHPLNGDQAVAQFKGTKTTKSVVSGETSGARYTKTGYVDPSGRSVLEHWLVHSGGHVWFGGNKAGSYTSPKGPDASREMVRFFLSA